MFISEDIYCCIFRWILYKNPEYRSLEYTCKAAKGGSIKRDKMIILAIGDLHPDITDSDKLKFAWDHFRHIDQNISQIIKPHHCENMNTLNFFYNAYAHIAIICINKKIENI